MVSGEHDHRVVGQPLRLQMVEQPTDLLVEHRHGGIVGTGELALRFLARRHARFLEQRFRREGGRIGRQLFEFELRRIVGVVRGPRRIERPVRRMKADRREERPRGVAFRVEKLDRPLGDGPVVQLVGRIGDSDV